MTEYIVLSKYDILSLNADRPVFIYVDGKCYVLCTDKYKIEPIQDKPPCGRCRYHDDYADKSIRPTYCKTMCANNWNGFRERER